MEMIEKNIKSAFCTVDAVFTACKENGFRVEVRELVCKIAVVECLYQLTQIDGLNDSYLQQALASQLATSEFTQQTMLMLYQESRLLDKKQINEELTLNSTIIDLTSSIQQLDS